MKITITREDIEGGRRRDPNGCAVALALKRAGVAHFGVTGMLVMVQLAGKHTPIVLPSLVQEWILDFDWGMPVGPLEFELTLPEWKEEANGQEVVLAEAPARSQAVSPSKRRANGQCGSRQRTLLAGFPRLGVSLARSFRGRKTAPKPESEPAEEILV